jgi:transcriptional regulator with XRE-family HTH domain
MVDFGLRIKKLRQSKNLTQLQLAKRLNISKSMISAYENDIRLPSYDVLIKLSRIFNVSTDFLLEINSNRTINVSGLTDKQIEIINTIIGEFQRK